MSHGKIITSASSHAAAVKPTLKDKRVLFLASGMGSDYYARALTERGANVTETANNSGGLPQGQADEAIELLNAMTPPAAVVIFMPAMKILEGSFEQDPTMRVAAAAKKLGIPTMVIDSAYKEKFSEAESLAMKNAGITLIPNIDALPFKAADQLASIIHEQGRAIKI